MPADRPETCPTCGVGEPWNRYSYKKTDGDGRPLIVYTESGGDGDRDECVDPWHGDDLADRVLAQVKDPASPLSKALWGDATPTPPAPTPPAPADDAGGAEAMRAEFIAWVNAGYLARDAVTPVEWDDEGLPVYYTRDDGVRHYLDGEWHAWRAARALPLPARDDAVERDADRFRWLMERNFGFAFDAERCGISTGRWGRWPEEPDEQRAMIDRAIAAEASAVRDGKGE